MLKGKSDKGFEERLTYVYKECDFSDDGHPITRQSCEASGCDESPEFDLSGDDANCALSRRD